MTKKTLHFLTLLGVLVTFGAFGAGCGSQYVSQDAPEVDGRMEEIIQPGEDGDFSAYEGIWPAGEQYDYDYIRIDADGSWLLYQNGDIVKSGQLKYEPEWESIYAYDDADGSGCQFRLEDDGELYIGAYGYFDYYDDGLGDNFNYENDGLGDNFNYEDDGLGDNINFENDGLGDNFNYENDGLGDNVNYENDGRGDVTYDEYSPNPELYQVDVSQFAGTWYYDGDYAASTFIDIDRYGNWSYYERAQGEAEATEMDYGTFTYSTSEASIYYANSSVYGNVSYRVFDFDNGILVWDDYGTYERME